MILFSRIWLEYDLGLILSMLLLFHLHDHMRVLGLVSFAWFHLNLPLFSPFFTASIPMNKKFDRNRIWFKSFFHIPRSDRSLLFLFSPSSSSDYSLSSSFLRSFQSEQGFLFRFVSICQIKRKEKWSVPGFPSLSGQDLIFGISSRNQIRFILQSDDK